MERNRILIIDDEANIRDGLITLLTAKGYQTAAASDGTEALALLENEVFDLIITDYKMQQMDGMKLLEKINKEFPSCKVIMMTGYGSIEHAVEAMRSGAVHYLTKPIQPQKLYEIIGKTLHQDELPADLQKRKKALKKLCHFEGMVGLSKPMQEVYQKIRDVAGTDVGVFIIGESGTGKELVARAIHNLSPRKDKPFVAVNTGGIPRELIASELFGHVKGSFTGAITDKKGKFEEAHTGTLFLDEIGTMDSAVQISLLRVLETRHIEKVGGNRSIPVDVRIICATNEDLNHLIAEQKFREDLYYRLNVFAIELPPLRERKQDIPYLKNFYRELFNIELKKSVKGFTREASAALKKYYWPGNVRELRNVILRAMLSAKDTIDVKDLPPHILGGYSEREIIRFKAGTPLWEVEKTMVIQTLKALNGNKLRAAEVLGISRRSLYNKLEEYQIDPDNL
ncbi:MAG: sigma-54 dependent transcriptional regulator [Calditrichia bacterium]